MAQVSTVANWAPPVGVSLFTRLYFVLRSTWVTIVVDNPLAWKLGFRGKNAQDDVEGPFYIIGAPSRQIDDGKAVLASPEQIESEYAKHIRASSRPYHAMSGLDATHRLQILGPFLFVFDVKDAKGDPVPNATLDWWQADPDGNYYFKSWTLRGKVTTDAQGRVEVLSVRPGDYGAPIKALGRRSGHVHLVVSGAKGKHRDMTTQVYVCPANKQEHMMNDLANYARGPRPGNMATCWSIPAANGGNRYHDFPELSAEDTDLAERVRWWNVKLKEGGINREVLAVGRQAFKLSSS